MNIFEKLDAMGYDLERFEDKDNIDQDLICSICHDVLQDPVYFGQCEHSFCKVCILDCMKRKQECPVGRISLLSRLSI